MKYIFCLSNLSVPVTLSLIKDKEDFLIISDQESIVSFFKLIVPAVHVRLIPKSPNLKGIRKFIAPFYYSGYKRKLLKVLPQVADAKIYFFFNGFGENVSWWINRNRKDNSIFYSPDLDISNWPVRYNLKGMYLTFKSFSNYGLKIVPVWNGRVVIPKVSDAFLNKINARKTSIPVDSQFIDKIIAEKLKVTLDKSKIVLLGGNTVVDNIVQESDYIKYTDELITDIGIEKIILKSHPRYPDIFSLESKLIQLSPAIPANILIGFFEVFIGYSSASLFEVANAGKTAISLLEFYPPVNPEIRNNLKNYLTENLNESSIIHFPQNMEVLKNLLYEEFN